LRPEAKQLNGIDDTVELPNMDKPTRWEADVVRFFELTFPTQTLRQNIFTVVERFNQPVGAKGVFLIESPYGSGKSHVLLTLVHVLKCQPAAQQWVARWPSRERPTNLPTNLMVQAHSFVEKSPADFVNEVFLPLLGVPPQANRMVDVELLEGAIGSSPTLAGRRLVLILDELARWFSNLKSQPNGEQLVSRAEAFLQAAGNLSKRTDKLTLILSALPGLLPQNVQANIVRNAVQLPLRASDQQGVILHRIFENYDPGTVHPDARSMVESYRNAYTQASLPVEEVNRLSDDLLKTYPIHPDFMKLVVERFPKGSYFQNERGALNFVARVVSLAEDAGVTIVTSAHANVRDAVILRKLNNVDTSGHDLPRIAFDDLQNLPQQDPLHDQIMATVLTYSLVDNRDPGATREEVLRACVRPGLVPNDILAGLRTIQGVEHVWQQQDRYVLRDRRNPANTVAMQARRELQLHKKPFQDHIAERSFQDIFGRLPLVFNDPTSFNQQLAQLTPTLDANEVKFVVCARKLGPDERKSFYQGRTGANLFVLIEPLEAGYDVFSDDTLLFEAAKAKAAEKLAQESREAGQLSDASAYQAELKQANKSITERIRGAFGRMILWKVAPISYDDSELDPIQLRNTRFTYDAALGELKGFANDRETHRLDVLNHWNQLRGLAVPSVEQTFRDTLGLHIPVPKDVVGDTLISMAKDYEISLEHPNHTYCGSDDNYSVLTSNQRLELSRCKLADPRPRQAGPTILPSRPPIPLPIPGVGPTITPPIPNPGGPPTVPTGPTSAPVVTPENVGPITHDGFANAVQARLPAGAQVEHIEVVIEIQDSLQPANAAAWTTLAGAVDKPTDIDLSVKLTRHVLMTPTDIGQWLATLPVVPNADYRAFLKGG
jgi:hypothetical protein